MCESREAAGWTPGQEGGNLTGGRADLDPYIRCISARLRNQTAAVSLAENSPEGAKAEELLRWRLCRGEATAVPVACADWHNDDLRTDVHSVARGGMHDTSPPSCVTCDV